MSKHLVKSPGELTDTEIKNILDAWEIDEWKTLTAEEFRKRFEHSEFHILIDDDSRMVSVARINFRFKVKIDETVYPIAELVGFVAIVILQGYGKELLRKVAENLNGRQIEAVAFCRKRTSTFYETTGFKLFYDKVKFLREWKDEQWFTPREDDDIVNLTLTEPTVLVFENLSEEKPAYLIFE